jgi:hypothetical protein
MRDQEIARLIAEGRTVREIQAETDCDSRDVARVRREGGFPTRESKRAAVAALMKTGVRPYMAAELVGVSKSVAYRLRLLGGGNG